jgi:hypothetical protein
MAHLPQAHFKRIYGLYGAIEKDMIVSGQKHIYVAARETVHIPFVLRSYNCGRIPLPLDGCDTPHGGHTPPDPRQRPSDSCHVTASCRDVVEGALEGVPGITPDATALKKRTTILRVKTVATQLVTAVLNIDVNPQPFVVDARLQVGTGPHSEYAYPPVLYQGRAGAVPPRGERVHEPAYPGCRAHEPGLASSSGDLPRALGLACALHGSERGCLRAEIQYQHRRRRQWGAGCASSVQMWAGPAGANHRTVTPSVLAVHGMVVVL